MEWSEYSRKFSTAAAISRKSDSYIERCLDYSERLFDQGLPIIYSTEHLAFLIGIEPSYLYSMAFSPNKFYRHFKVKKKSDGFRDIYEPMPDLMRVQRWILEIVLSCIPVNPCAKAFVKGKSIKDNARFHRGQQLLVNTDIEDFFPSVSSYQVFTIFKNLGYAEKLAWSLTNLCTLNGGLPQGAPTSPYLSNLVMRDVDEKVFSFCLSRGYRYTRYADDMSVSGDVNVSELLFFLKGVLNTAGFKINDRKTRVLGKGQRQEVTGIVVNEHLQIPRHDRRLIRQEVHYIKKHGLNNHLAYIHEDRRNYLQHLLGKVEYALFVNPRDAEMAQYKTFLRSVMPENRMQG